MSSHIPEPVRSTMEALVGGLLAILGTRLAAVYLGGSITMDDFCEASSDLDFLVVTRGRLSMEDALAVELLHKDMLRRYPFAALLEGDYAPLEVLVPEGTTEPVPGCERGIFLPKVGEIMLSADNVMNMTLHGITFYGPHPAQVLPAVSPAQLRAAVRAMLADAPGAFRGPAELARELLSILRSACALEAGQPVSKSMGARWGLTHLDNRWHPAIEAAQAARCGDLTPAGQAALESVAPDLADLARSVARGDYH